MRKVLAVCAGWLLAGLVLSAPTAANAATEPDCRTSTSYLTRPDHGHGTDNGGYWATLKIERTTTICQLPSVAVTTVNPPERALYRATVVDEGTLVTIAGEHLSPNDAKALKGNVPGFVVGEFKVDFEATAGFLTYEDTFGDKTYSGIDSPVSTGKWVPGLWGADDYKVVKDIYAWGWTYWTCTKNKASAPEFWWDAEDPASDDGTTDAAGDITGKPCPSPSASPSPSPSASATPTASVSTAPPAASNEDSLPVTGVGGKQLLGWAVLLLFSGGLVYWLFSRVGRKTFEGRLDS